MIARGGRGLPALVLLLLLALLGGAARSVEAQTGCTNPALCGLPVASTTNQADLAVAIDVVLVGDGFIDMTDWHAVAAGAIAGFQGAGSNMYGRVPGLYNFHVVDVVSAGTDVSNTDVADTALGMRVSGPFITVDQGRANLAALNAPDVDVVVAIANSGGGRANANYPSQLASGGTVRLSRNTGVLTHELGHALFHLADEYEETALCSSPTEGLMLREPNVTTDATCHKFAGIPGAACVQGGRYCSTGTYRSAATCFMRTNNGAACPACARELDEVLRERRSQRDWAPPWLIGTPPGRGSPVAGPIALEAQAHDDWFTPTTLAFEIDGAYVGSISAAGSGQLPFDSTRLADGAHTLRVFGADARGFSRAALAVPFSSLNATDLTAPTLAINTPAAGAMVSGVVSVFVSVAAPAGDVRELVLLVDGQPVAGASGTGTLFYGWDTSAAGLGAHVLTARAVDYSENVGTSAPVSVTVVAPPPPNAPFVQISSPRDGTRVGPYFVLEWAAEGGPGGSGLQGGGSVPVALVLDNVVVTPNPLAGRDRSAVIDARAWSLGPHQLRVRTLGVPAVDSPPVLVVRSAITAPEAFIRNPQSGRQVRGVVPVEVLGVDDVAISSVTLLVDGTPAGSVAGASGTISLPTAARTGCLSLVAEALSSDGARGRSEATTVCVDNTAPSVAIEWPTPGAEVVVGPVVVRTRVTEQGSGIERLQLRVDGVLVHELTGSGALLAPLAAGPHTLVVVARDRAGNEGTSAPVSVTAVSACTAAGCDDGDSCTVDRCGPSGACVHAQTPGCCVTAADCADSDACTTELCTNGTCSTTPVAGCCNHTNDCDDGDRCTSDVCSGPGGTCSHPSAGCCTTAADCDDGRSCTTDTCVGSPGGACAHDWAPGCCTTTADCDDGDACTAEACTNGTCGSTPIAGCCRSSADCNDNDRCTADVCTNGVCGQIPLEGCCATAADCSSLNPCVTTTCNARGSCEAAPVVGCCSFDFECADSDPCTVHACTNNGCTLVSATAGCADAGVAPDATVVVDAGVRDAAAPDAAPRDAAAPDAVVPDAAAPDAAPRDAAAPDASPRDAAAPDAAPRDAAAADAAPADASSRDAAAPDAVVADDAAQPVDDAAMPVDDATVPVDDAAVPVDDAAVPVDDATTPLDDATTPLDDATTPVDDATVSPSDDAAAGPDATAPLPTVDAGAPATDAEAPAGLRDGDTPDPITGSCSCSTERTRRGAPHGVLLVLVGVAAVWSRRRRNARR
jgi:MYXO-CTERM domain-containing protein